MGVWLLHPMHVSTMMLTIQRMVLLMSFFTLLGLIFYTKGRLLLSARPLAGYVLMSIGIVAGGTLATLSKENGVLLPLYALTLEATLFSKLHTGTARWGLKRWKAIFLVLPLVMLSGYFLLIPEKFSAEYARRDFSLAERLLTEPRIILDYLSNILLPRLRGSGIFHDDFTISTGLFSPPSTAGALVALFAGVSFAVVSRRRFPFAAFAIFWFFAGHALESTFIWLELYFEHRNYLPMFGLFVFVVWLLSKLPDVGRRASVYGLVAFMALESFLVWQGSNVWASENTLVQVWSRENPKSLRAQQLAASYWQRQGQYSVARRHLAIAQQHHPDSLSVFLQISLLECEIPDGKTAADKAYRLAPKAAYQDSVFSMVTRIRMLVNRNACDAWRSGQLIGLLDVLLENAAYNSTKRTRGFLLYEQGRVAIEARKPRVAVAALSGAYCEREEPQLARYLIGYLVALGDAATANKVALAVRQDGGSRRLLGNSISRPEQEKPWVTRGTWAPFLASCLSGDMHKSRKTH